MKRFIWLVPVMVLAFSLPARADYREMLEEYENYHPEVLYENSGPEAECPPVPQPDREWEKAKSDLDALKNKYLRQGGASCSLTCFYQPPAARWKELQPAGGNQDQAARILSGEFALPDLIILSLLRNPGLKAARKRVLAETEAFSQVESLQETLRQYTAFTEGQMTGAGRMIEKDPLAMKFPYPGMMSLQGQAAEQQVKISREDWAGAVRTTVTAARKSYWDLLYLHKAHKVTMIMIDLLEQLNEVVTTLYKTGRTPFQDVAQIGIKLELVKQSAIDLDEERKNQETRIRQFVDLPESTALGRPADVNPVRPIPELDGLYRLGLIKRQELKRLRARIALMNRMIEMAKLKIFDQPTANYSLYENEAVVKVGTDAKVETFPTRYQAATGAGQPKRPFTALDSAYWRQTVERLAALKEELKQTENLTRTEIREAWFRAERSQRQVGVFENSILNLTQSALESAAQGYESGLAPFSDVISVHSLWLENNLAWEKEKTNFGRAWAELEAAVGGSIDDLK